MSGGAVRQKVKLVLKRRQISAEPSWDRHARSMRCRSCRRAQIAQARRRSEHPAFGQADPPAQPRHVGYVNTRQAMESPTRSPRKEGPRRAGGASDRKGVPTRGTALQTARGVVRFRQAAGFDREAKKFTRPLSEHALGAPCQQVAEHLRRPTGATGRRRQAATSEEMSGGATCGGDLTLLILDYSLTGGEIR
jgi:hypothetical protein